MSHTDPDRYVTRLMPGRAQRRPPQRRDDPFGFPTDVRAGGPGPPSGNSMPDTS